MTKQEHDKIIYDLKLRPIEECFVNPEFDYLEAWRNNSIVQELIDLKKRVAELEERAMK